MSTSLSKTMKILLQQILYLGIPRDSFPHLMPTSNKI